MGTPAAPIANGELVMDLKQLRESLDPSALPVERMQIQFMLSDSSAVWLRADRAGVRVCRGISEREPDLVVRSSVSTLNFLYWGHITCRVASSHRVRRAGGSRAGVFRMVSPPASDTGSTDHEMAQI